MPMPWCVRILHLFNLLEKSAEISRNRWQITRWICRLYEIETSHNRRQHRAAEWVVLSLKFILRYSSMEHFNHTSNIWSWFDSKLHTINDESLDLHDHAGFKNNDGRGRRAVAALDGSLQLFRGRRWQVRRVRQRQSQRQQQQLEMQLGNKNKLVFLSKSPDYCKSNDTLGILGTRGRVCDQSKSKQCNFLCCGRGYSIKVVTCK